MKRTVKAWAVVWTKKGRKEYGVPLKDNIISVEPKEEVIVFKDNKKFLYAESVAVFTRKQEANAFHEGNIDWDVVPCTITYETP